MSIVTLDAHLEGKTLCLDEPYVIPPGATVKVVVFTGADESLAAERRAWRAASQAAFARAYGADEPDYSAAVIRERPPCE
ncbi:MAG: hypothetical protein EXS35_15055 [Pedosphaera sp.]|nr:hypothetical protein [Pedosphaera sp.]